MSRCAWPRFLHIASVAEQLIGPPKQEAERRVHKTKADGFAEELQRAAESHAKMKADATERERSLGKIQAILNERRQLSASMEAKVLSYYCCCCCCCCSCCWWWWWCCPFECCCWGVLGGGEVERGGEGEVSLVCQRFLFSLSAAAQAE